jgi:hypothetical protein
VRKSSSLSAVASERCSVELLLTTQQDHPAACSLKLLATVRLVELPRLSVSEVDRLTLRVSFADRGSVSDIANWCDVVLLKSDQ